MRDEGLIRHLGLSNVTPAHLAEAESIAPVVCVQNAWGVDYRRDTGDEMVALCAARGIAFVPFFALAGERREEGASGTHGAAVRAVANELRATPAQVRLAWTLQYAPNVLAIPGTGDVAHLRENVAAAALRLTPAQMATLN
jgi:pyridoxine 4-dehydrogenase